MDDMTRRGILAMLLLLTSGLPLMVTGPLLADELVTGAMSGPCQQPKTAIASLRSGPPGADCTATYPSPATRQ